ncbi:ATP-dependent DNA helicase [Legionella antarctica]|uniref:DNA 3'-5' helicase n=1 Tax=Legionella antarctica TaxID=2708020 RepID=A0A6F8T7M9_9GAMM|nr:UvrD-helicase domain-containing protein [Legionella antarctica]BCA96150.1 ATP-dependent DNA helicase [Legionella antarctica]
MSLLDSDQRSKATNPGLSFIVQAPAGSGKTEILTQRFLRLLSTVTAPEQIIALTFTRKAASEMRERIVLALQQAASNLSATSPHQQMTLDFAKHALSRSHQYQWDLLQQPNRLKVITIDSLCQSINHSIPLLEKQIAYPRVTDNPESHYLDAARRCIQFATETPEYQSAIKALLLHVDNKQDRLLNLFKTLLSQRDQWLSPLFQARAQNKSTFEHALRLIEQHELARCKNSLPPQLASEVTQLTRELASIENNPNSPRYLLKDWHDFQQINQEISAALSQTLLVGDKGFRKSFDHHVGLKQGVCTDAEYRRLKTASKELLTQLKDHPDFLNSLIQVSKLPKPEYDKEQWDVLQALFVLLPLLVSHLHVFFSEHNEVDFTAISQQALTALGDADNPTDLALYLDNAIHHLLVDEFQDTSITQFELLTKLVQGWQADDGKTMFVVGDPMQSIYRFRQAEVGLFFRAKENGIGPVRLQSLELRCNFRSSETIVDWVNNHFSKIFPQKVDIESGAVSFHPSINVIKDKERSAIQALQFKDKKQEAETLIKLIENELKINPDQTLAILVRSRTHLTEIINLLRQYQIPYQGTDIDLLANLEHLRDVWSLTHALLFPGNRLSWLAMLRSPYCGLSLNDILYIAQFNKNKSIHHILLQLDKIQFLSEEGRIRAGFFIQVMQQALSQRYHGRLSDWVVQTLKELHVEKILNQSQLNDLDQLWTLLDRYEQEGRLPDTCQFLNEFNKLYSQQTTPSRLHIMTIHKSKGLEFDTVFLPGLGAQPNRGENPMLRWLNIATPNHGNLALVSPIQAAHQDHCVLYDYLSQLDDEKNNYESQRLLYVAATRAKSRLYLTASSSKSSKRSFHSLLKNQEFLDIEHTAAPENATLSLPTLTTLPLVFYSHNKLTSITPLNAPPPDLSAGIPRLTGIVSHQFLQWICERHPKSIEQIPWNLARDEFKKLGFDKEMQQSALSTLQDQITLMFHNKTGAWIISRHHNEQNEYELLVEAQDTLVTRIIDRTFEDNGKLWIIDFKTGTEAGIASTQHQKQLNEYGYYLSSRTNLPIHCGLYYLNSGHWVSWHYQPVPIG